MKGMKSIIHIFISLTLLSLKLFTASIQLYILIMDSKGRSNGSFAFENMNRPLFGLGVIGPPRKKIGNADLENGKIYEARIKKYKDYVSLMTTCHQLSIADAKGSYLEKMRFVKDRINSFKYLQMKNLDERRQHLRELLSEEESRLTEEMNRCFPTAETRFHETMSLINDYKQKKELDRQEFAKQMYEMRYRRANPDLNKKLLQYRRHQVAADNPHNIHLRNQLKQADKEAERLIDVEYFRRNRENIAKEEEKFRLRRENNKKVSAENVNTLQMNKQKESDAAKTKLEEEKQLLAEIAVEKREFEAKEFAKKIEKLREYKKMNSLSKEMTSANQMRTNAPRLAFDQLQRESLEEALHGDYLIATDRRGRDTAKTFLEYDRDLKKRERVKEKQYDHLINQEAHKMMLAELAREKQKYKKWKTAERDNQEFILQEIQRKEDERVQDKADKLTWKTSIELPSETLPPVCSDLAFKNDLTSQIKFHDELKQQELDEKLREQTVMKREEQEYVNTYNSILAKPNVDQYDHPMRKKYRELYPGRI